VGQVIRFDDKEAANVDCIACISRNKCPSRTKHDCAFMPMWKKVKDSIFEIYDTTTIADLLAQEKERA
jgi:DNA-binding IscR family transcriptional regulator